MKILTIVTTYQRPQLAERLLDQIIHQKKDHDMEVMFFDDGSTDPNYHKVKEKAEAQGCSWTRFNFNLGKHGHWKMVDCIWQLIKDREFDIYFHLQDDITLFPGFFQLMLDTWESIDDDSKVCLNPRV